MLALCFTACKRYEYKVCDFHSDNEQTLLYNQILNELVETQFYTGYLGNDAQKVWDMHINDEDSTDIKREIINIQNKIFKDSNRFCYVYLDTIMKPTFYSQEYFLKGATEYSKNTVALFRSFSNDLQAVIDSLNTHQKMLKASDFQLCTSKVMSLTEEDSTHCVVGKISFSKVFLSKTKDKGLLFIDFYCGPLCGYESLLVIEKINSRWTVKQNFAGGFS